MTDTLVLAIVIAVSAAVIAWSIRYAGNSWEHDARALLGREIRRQFDRHEAALFKRYAEMQRRLDRHHRILKYLARRLS